MMSPTINQWKRPVDEARWPIDFVSLAMMSGQAVLLRLPRSWHDFGGKLGAQAWVNKEIEHRSGAGKFAYDFRPSIQRN
ncbi:MAG: hypothetical protein U1E20_08970 [Methylocystis sp.]|uniref:hypothetical protein n=1 Tax=Methylocystis sp. TaxID=1911079 RepID=UPI003956146C